MRTGQTFAQPITEQIDRWMRLALIVGIVAAVISVVGIFLSGPAVFFQAYLFAFLFWLGISLGCLVMLLLHFSVRSRWGLTIRRITEAASGSLWVMALLFIPLIFGLGSLYPWANPGQVAASPMLQSKSWYLNVPFFIIRAVIYFAIWIGMAFLINRTAARVANLTPAELATRGRMQGWSAFGLVVYGITIFFASVDWLMSLTPGWTSTAFGLVIALGQVLTGLAFAILMLNLIPSLSLGRRWTYDTTPAPYGDLGALLMTLVMGYTYVAFFQLLIQWAGNIPEEVIWYAMRTQGGWNILAIFIALFEFVLPFCILLTIRARHNLRVLAILAGVLLFSYLVNMFWHVKPNFSPTITLSWLDIVLPVALGGLWMAGFLYTLKRRPALSPANQAVLQLNQETEEIVP